MNLMKINIENPPITDFFSRKSRQQNLVKTHAHLNSGRPIPFLRMRIQLKSYFRGTPEILF